MAAKLLGAIMLIAVAGRAHAEEAITAFEDSVALYGMGKMDASLEKLEAAARAAADSQLLAKIHRQRAFIYARRGERERAIASFVDALRLDPKITVDPREHRPEVIALFLCARRRDRGQSCDEPPKPPPRAVIVEPPPAEPAEPASSLRTWALAPAAATLVFGGAAAFFYARAGARHDQLIAADPPVPFVPPEELRDEGARAQTIGSVFVVGAGVALVSAALMFAFGDEL